MQTGSHVDLPFCGVVAMADPYLSPIWDLGVAEMSMNLDPIFESPVAAMPIPDVVDFPSDAEEGEESPLPSPAQVSDAEEEPAPVDVEESVMRSAPGSEASKEPTAVADTLANAKPTFQLLDLRSKWT